MVAVLVLLGACTEVPELEDVAATIAPGTPGLGGNRVSNAVADTNYGKAIAAATRNNPALTQAGAAIRAAQAEARAADGIFKPELSVGIGAESRIVRGSTDSNVSPFARVSQLVYDGGAARADLSAARARVIESRATRIENASAAALAAVEAHYNLVSRRKLLALAQENLRALQRIANQIDERAVRGAGSSADQLTAQSRLADAETQLADARGSLERAQARYSRYFGGIPASLPSARKAPALSSQDEENLRLSPRLRAIEARLRAAEADLSAAKARQMPSVELGATGRRASGGGGDVGFDLSVSYSLDTRGQRAAAVDAAQARLDGTQAERDQLLRDIQETLAFARSDQRAGTARVAAARAAVASNKASVEAAREQFGIGRRSLIDLLDAQRDHVRAQEVLIAAEQDRFLTDYAVLALTGDILDVFSVKLTEVPQ
jgi:adhesin transport system outer membrane protein